MRELVLVRTFEAPPEELFERATEDSTLETKLLTLTNKREVTVSEWIRQDSHMTRSIGYLIPASHSAILSQISKGSDLSITKFQDVFSMQEKVEFILDSKVFYGQTQAISTYHVSLQQLESTFTNCTISIKSSCKNALIRDKVESCMEEEASKELGLWMDMLWESHMAHKALQHRKPQVVEVDPVVVHNSSVSTTPTAMRSLARSYNWSTQNLQEMGELEELKVLSGGISNLSDDLDLLRRTVESHYVRLCSLESHLSSQSQPSRLSSQSPSSANFETGDTNPHHIASSSTSSPPKSLRVAQQVQPPHLAFNSLEELEVRQRELRSQLTTQMQHLEKSLLKQQQASLQFSSLESRWETMYDKMTKRLQHIDTMRYGLFGSWRYSVSLLLFVIIWPLVVRYLWNSFGSSWAHAITRKYWRWNLKRSIIVFVSKWTGLSLIKSATSASPSSPALSIANAAASTSSLTNAAVAASNAIADASHPVLAKLTPQSFWR